ncbi:MAG: putative 4-mercaptohistidine N1-methyltransferase, partial [Verrucomicrobiales bacterium]|nr:putative 4-mercaptohistidine N1-methyltransferase [Verrucomicrobiales bacterium]
PINKSSHSTHIALGMVTPASDSIGISFRIRRMNVSSDVNPYESTTLLDQYLLFHFGSEHEIAPPAGTPADSMRFPTITTALAPQQKWLGSALDLGCAVGRSSFALSESFRTVLGIDFSHAFIQAAETIRTAGSIEYQRHDEGHLCTPLIARRPAMSNPERITFQVGDATSLPADIGSFDLVHAANLICRLPDPASLLKRFASLVKPGGQLVLTTPCTWLGEFTPPNQWPDKPTLAWLKDHLEPNFILDKTHDLPFLIRETSRKFQWSTAHGSVWVRGEL